MTDEHLIEVMARATNPECFVAGTNSRAFQFNREATKRQAQAALDALRAAGYAVVPVERDEDGVPL